MLNKLRSRHPLDIPYPWGRRRVLVGLLLLLVALFVALPLASGFYYGTGLSAGALDMGAVKALALGLGSALVALGVATLVIRY